MAIGSISGIFGPGAMSRRSTSAPITRWPSKCAPRTIPFENRIDLTATREQGPGLVGILASGTLGPYRIEGNTIFGGLSGIIVNDQPNGQPEAIAEQVSVTGNLIFCSEPPANAQGALVRIGIDLASDRSLAAENWINLSPRGAGASTGIRLTGAELKAIYNSVSTFGEGPSATIGVLIGYTAANGTSSTSGVMVAGNSISGCRAGIAGMTASLLDIGDNRVEGGRERVDASFGVVLIDASSAQVHDNQVSGLGYAIASQRGRANRFAANLGRDGVAGVFVTQEDAPHIAQNRIDRMRMAGIVAMGITDRCDIIENRITACGFGADLGWGVNAYELQGELNVKGNEVMNTAWRPKEGSRPPPRSGFPGCSSVKLRSRAIMSLIPRPTFARS
jgi:hypothetical protein